jgi:hypothetical protein
MQRAAVPQHRNRERTRAEGQACGEDDADDWLLQTGRRKLERRPLAGPSSLIVAEAIS